MTPERDAAAVLDAAVAARAFPGAVAETGDGNGPLWRHATGSLTYEPTSPAATDRTLYDLASLTKVIATTSVAMRLAERGALDLAAPVSAWMPEWAAGPYAGVTVRHLLDHSAGLPAWLPLFHTSTGRDEFRRAIAAVPPAYEPGSASIYSDLGFISLGTVVESAGGRDLGSLFEAFRADAALPASLTYGITAGVDVAPTEFDPWRGRMLTGEVHDENAFALSSAAPHAGLFGTAADAGAFARVVLRTFSEVTALGTPAEMKVFATRTGVPGSSRALGWDTMVTTSSCGSRMSAEAIGHTGFTGTSLWIDPAIGRYFVLLTNRVHPVRENNAIRAVRRAFHDALLAAAS
ncbi:MAG: beta-lactamase family protein [Acidobacteriota bacterium]|nr:beta-lactamase family protein [Acidobacteriota bacterium]